MLFDARNLPPSPSYESQPSNEELDALKYAEKYQKKRTRRLLGAQALILAATTAVSAYWGDVENNREVQASASASIDIHESPLNPENDSSAIVFFNGFGTYDAGEIADTFSPGLKKHLDGESWSISYGNAPLNTKKIARQIVELADERNITTLDIVGYSAGGVIGIDTAAELAADEGITIRSITTVSTPDGIQGLRPYQRKELESAELLAAIPGAQYSTAVRFGGEVYFMRNRFDKGDPITRVQNFGKAALQAKENLSRPNLPGTWLLVDQTLAIADADIKANLKKINELYGQSKPLPSLLYLGTGEPGRDYMVDDDTSSMNICRYARLSKMICSTYDVPGAIHTMPAKTADAYTTAFAEAGDTLTHNIERSERRYVQVQLEKFYSTE